MRSIALMALVFVSAASPWTKVEETKPEDQEIAILQATSKAFARVGKRASPAVVSITVHGIAQQQVGPVDLFEFFGFPGGPQQQQPQQQLQKQVIGQGSGFIVSDDGYILTNNHIVRGADKIQITLNNGREYTAEVVGTDPKTDLAVVKIDAKDLPTISLGDSEKVEIGEWVIAIGNPLGLNWSLTVGVVSAKGRNGLQLTEFEDFIQTDAAINPGNSGGPLLNLDGEVIGVNTALASRSGGYMGLGFAIPSNMAKQVMDQLIKSGSVTRGYLGIQLQAVDQDVASAFDLPKVQGILVADVLSGSPAEKGGIQQGDIILELNGQTVDSVSGFRNQVSLMAPNSTVRLTIVRDGKNMTKPLMIGEHPQNLTQEGSKVAKLGLQIDPLTDDLARQLGYLSEKGVVVREVDPNSPAAMAGIRQGTLIVQVNQTPVATPEEFAKAVDAALKGSSGKIGLWTRQGQLKRFVTLKMS